MTAKLFSPSTIVAIDMADSRLEAARRFGADLTINNGSADAVAEVMKMTGGLGADVAIEAVGVPETFELAAAVVRPGGHVANIGVHGKPVTLHLEKLWIRNVTITTGLVDTYTTPTLIRLLQNGQFKAGDLVTQEFELDEIVKAYDVFSHPAETGALKVVLGKHTGQPTLSEEARHPVGAPA
jgi:alcohol dehydrogenase